MPSTNLKPRLHSRIIERITGFPYSTLFSLWVAITLGFALLYAGLATFAPEQAPQHLVRLNMLERLGNSIYYSIITATTTGYGDIVPHGFSKIFASLQSISSMFVFAVFVGKLVSQQQDIAVREVHKLTYEDVFHNIREGLYIIRKDFDHLLKKLEHKDLLTLADWEDLATAFKQGQSLLLEIPEFYGGDDNNHLYIIDDRREQLLQEAVERTLHRINHLIDACDIGGIDWHAHEESMTELREFLTVVNSVTPLWHKRSPYSRHEAFDRIIRLKDRILNRLDNQRT